MRLVKVIARFARRRRHRCFMLARRRREPRAEAAQCGGAGGFLSRLPGLAAFCDNAGGDGGLAHERKLPGLHPRKDIRPIARNAVDQILAAVAALYPLLRRQLLAAAGARRLPMVLRGTAASARRFTWRIRFFVGSMNSAPSI